MTITSYRKKDGKTYYELRAYIGMDPRTGKQKQIRRCGFQSKKDAQLAYIELTKAEEKKEVTRLTFEDVYKEWIKEYKTTVKESTLKHTDAIMHNHVLPIWGGLLIARIERQDAQKAINNWSGFLDRFTSVKIVADMVFKYAVRHGYIDKSPFELVTIPKKQKIKEFENYLDREELKQLLLEIKKHSTPMWYCYFYLLAMTGMRRGEALALEWNDVDFTNKTIRVNKTVSKALEGNTITSPKTSSSNRTINVSQDVIDVILHYKGDQKKPTGLIFKNSKGSTITLSHPTRRLDSVLKKSGFKHITPHGLRHTHCCLLFEAGASIAQVQHRLGHSDIKTTLEVYNHVTEKKAKEVPDLFGNYLDN